MKIYLERQYNHRYPGALIGAVVMIAVGGVTLLSLLSNFGKADFPEFSIGFMLFALLLTGGSGLFIYAGATLAYGWLSNRTDRLTITEEGIAHFGKSTKWDEIKLLSYGCKRKGELVLLYQRKGLGFDRYLPVAEPLSETEIKALFHELKVDLEPIHEELRIG